MRNLHLFFTCVLLIPFAGKAQEVEILLNKNEYKLNEQIPVTFQINTTVDSVGMTDFNDFEILAGPSQTNSMSMINGVTSSTFRVTYILQAKRTGTFRITSPKFFQGNGIFIGRDASIIVKGKVSDEDLRKVGAEKFRNNPFKPRGTKRYNISGNIGYVEFYNGFNWEFYRDLTGKELKKLKSIK